MEESRRLVVRGFVQGVGYRAFIQMMARRLGIKGRVSNLDDGRVEIIVTGQPESLERFAKLIDIKAESPFEPDVHEIEIGKYSGDASFDNFRIDYGYDMTVAEKEMIERSEIGILAFGWMGKYLGNKIDTVGQKVDNVAQKVDTVAQKVDNVGNKIDALSEKVDAGFGDISGEIKLTREELGEKIDASNEGTENFDMEMVQKFDALDVKYGIIGQGLNEMNGRFKQLEGDVREMKDAFLKLVEHMTEE